MARLPRLALTGHAHGVLQRGLDGKTLFVDDQDRQAYLAALGMAATAEHTRIHAWALLDHEVRLVATPEREGGLARTMQAVGRRYVSAYNRRHGSHGTLFSGRFRSAVLEPGSLLLDALLWVDGAMPQPQHTSAGHRTGAQTLKGLTDPPEIWGLGNTPFEREAAYIALLATGLPASRAQALRSAILGGWASGDAAFANEVAAKAERPSRPRSAGRPPRPAAT